MNKIVIFKESMLAASERFILDQAIYLKNFEKAFVALKNSKVIDLSSIKCSFLENFSKIEVCIYKLFGRSPTLVNIIKKIKPDLIHIHMGGDAARFALLRKKFKIPIIVTFHGTDSTVSDEWRKKSKDLYSRYYLTRRHLLIKNFDHFIAISNFVKRKLIEKGFPENRITTHYIGIDIDFFHRTNNNFPLNKVLFVGRLIKVKGCHLLLQALSKLKVPNAVVIIGDGPERSFLEEMASHLKITASFLGTQDRTIVKKHLETSKVFCGPSYTQESGMAEGLGLVFLEAQAMGVPVVSFRSGGIPEAVVHNKTGFLYEEGDINGLSNGISTLLSDKILWEDFSKNAIEHIKTNFNIQEQTKKLENIYKEIIQQGIQE